jgi:hypothetical protein
MTAARLGLLAALSIAIAVPVGAAEPKGFLEGLKRQSVLSSTVPANGDQNPYALVVAPVSAGSVQKDDVLITNFNNSNNLQGAGSTIVGWRPSTKKLFTFATIPRNLAGCPGGIGLSTAMTMLSSGWVIVGSAPSTDGTTNTRGDGCLIVLDASGKVSGVIGGANVNMPWGNMATIDHGTTATVFVSNAGFGVGSPDGEPEMVQQATVLRLELAIAAGKPPVVTGQTVIGTGFGAQADKDVFLVGPTGLALAADGTLCVSDSTANRVMAIDRAVTRTDSGGIGREIVKDGLLKRPLAMATAPNGHLLVMNGLNGQVVEIDPVARKQIYARWIDASKAQTPPGSGDLFGIAMTPEGDGFYFVMDEVNALAIAR